MMLGGTKFVCVIADETGNIFAKQHSLQKTTIVH